MATTVGCKTAVIYARFSCSKQREASIEDQLRICREWCEKEGYQIVAEYCDRAASGRTDERAQFQHMISNAGESDIVLVYMMDRFSRDVYDAPIYKRKLRDKGVKVVSATETVPDGPEAILIESIYEAMAAMESAHIAQRTKRGMEGNALKCHHNGVKVFGYRWGEDGRYVVDPLQAEVVREVFKRHIAGEPTNAIAADLARRGWKTTNGTRFSSSAVEHILRNQKYTGVYKWGDTVIEGGVPAIIGADVWEASKHVVIKKQRRSEDWSDYPLTGHAECLGCGKNLVGVSGRGKKGVKYTYYRCADKCGCKPVRAGWLEGAIVAKLRKMLSSRKTAVMIAEKISATITDEEAAARLKEANRSLADAERGITNILRAVEDGMPWNDVSGRMAELKEQRAKAEADAAVWSAMVKIDPEDFADFLQFGATLDDRSLLESFVWRVGVDDDDVVVILNYDMKKSEPARIEIRRGFALFDFGSPSAEFFEIDGFEMALSKGRVAIRFKRAA